MTDGTTASTTPTPAVADDGLSDDWNDILGDDYTATDGAGDELPETPSAGAPPAESRETSKATSGSEGANAAEHAGAPPADAAATKDRTKDPAAPDATAGTEGTAGDPLAGATPLTYTVDGQERTAEGIHRFDDGSAFIDAAFLPTLQQRLSERDHYYEKDRANHERYTALNDAFTRLTSWNAGKDQRTGQDRILTGVDSIEHQRVLLGRSIASHEAIVAALQDPAVLASLVDVQVNPQDGQAYIVPSKQGLDTLWLRADNAAMRAEAMARTAMGTVRSTLRAAPSQPSAAPQVPAPTEAQWLQTVDAQITANQLKSLTAEDRQFLARLAPKYMRDATPEERVSFGAKVLDASFLDVMKDRAALRGQMTSTATTAPQVAAENAKRLAAAQLGARPAAPSTPVTPAAPKRTDADEAWDAKERAAAALFRRRAG